LAALLAHYQAENLLNPLRQVQIPMRKRYFEPADKLIQILVCILTDCATLSEVNPTRLRHGSQTRFSTFTNT
jgi:hypothetical protein